MIVNIMQNTKSSNEQSFALPFKSIDELRHEIKRLERLNFSKSRDIKHPFTTGIMEIDKFLPSGGLTRGALHEFFGSSATTAGFVAALLSHTTLAENGAVMWCRSGSELYAPGLASLGLEPERLLLVRSSNTKKLLWAMEEGLRSGLPIAVIGEIDRASSISLRRLQLAAETGGIAAFLIQCNKTAVSSPAATCWRIKARPSTGKLPSISWKIQLIRVRGGVAGEWELEQQNERQERYAKSRFSLISKTVNR